MSDETTDERPAPKHKGPPTHWRIKQPGVGGFKRGSIVPADDLAPHVGAMHGRGLIEPAEAPAPEPEPESHAKTEPDEA